MPWYGYALLTAVSISVLSMIQKRVLRQEHSLEYVTVFSVLKVAMFLPLFWRQITWAVSPEIFWLMVLGSGIGAAAFLLIVKAMKRLELSTVTPLMALEPGLVSVLAVVFLGETVSGFATAGILLLIVGTYILELQHEPVGWRNRAAGSRTRWLHPFTAIIRQSGGWYAVMGLLAFTISALIARRVLLDVPATTYLAFDFIIVAVVYVVVFLGQRRRLAILQAGTIHLLPVVLLLASLHIAQSASQATAMTLAPIGLVIAIKRLSVLFDITIGGRLFHEHRLRQKLIAAIIIIAGVLLIVVL